MEAEQLDAAPIWTNLKTFPWQSFNRCVDIVSGGYPCQPFSAAGKRLGTDDPRHLWPWIRDGIGAMQPGLCFFENVEGHVSLGLREVIGDLESLGYTATWGLFSAAEVGADHKRKRVYILAAHPKRNVVQGRSIRPKEGSYAGADQEKQLPGYDFPDLWKEVPEPSFWGVDDGSAEIVDRNRLIGNGVVPATAERAFRVLFNRILKSL